MNNNIILRLRENDANFARQSVTILYRLRDTDIVFSYLKISFFGESEAVQ